MLIVAWAALSLGLSAFIYGLSLFMQRALYEQVADRLPLRALAAGCLIGTFLTGWAVVNARAAHPGKYGTLFDFSASSTRELDSFEAVRRLRFKDAAGNPREEVVAFRRFGNRMLDADRQEFRRASTNYVTIALVVTDDGKPVRFVAPMRDGVFMLDDRHAVYREESGRRTVSDENPTLMNVPSLWGAVGALVLNVVHYLLWFVALWPVVRLTLVPALVTGFVLATASMFVLVPVLFQTVLPR